MAKTPRSPGTTGMSLEPDGSVKTQMELRLEQLEARTEHVVKDTDRLDAFMANIRFFMTAFGVFVASVAGVIGWLGYKSLDDVNRAATAAVGVEIAKRLDKDAPHGKTLATLVGEIQNAEKIYAENKEYLESLKLVSSEEELSKLDPQYAYERVEELEEPKFRSDEDRRRAALGYLNAIILAGERGVVDPALLFNAATSANILGMREEGIKLATLAEHWQPAIDHKALKFEATHMLGRQYVMQDAKVVALDIPAIEVRESAWGGILEIIESAPRIGAELIYSRASNIANRNSVSGYFSDLIDAIETSADNPDNRLTSYAYVTLAQMYALRGDVGWRDGYVRALENAVVTLAAESPAVTWHNSTIQDMSQIAYLTDRFEDLDRLVVENGLEDLFQRRTAGQN